MRVLEQIKLDVCYEDLPVIFVGDGAGVVYSTLGTSHQSTEDVAALRALPRLVDPFAGRWPRDDGAVWSWLSHDRPGLSADGQVRPRHGS